MAPDIIKGICPHPCDTCVRKQIQQVMSTLSVEYPYEWSQMTQRFGR